MIKTQRVNLFAFFTRQNSPRISYICDIANVLDNKDDDRARATLVRELISFRIINFIHESVFSLLKSFDNSIFRISWKARLLNHIEVEVVSQEISALASAVAIIDTKVGASRPFLWIDVRSAFWRKQVCDDRNPIFVIVSHKALICVGCISSNDTCPFVRCLGRIIVWNDNLVSGLDTKLGIC